MNFQGVVMNVADLNRSIDFYREVLGFTVRSQEEQLAAMNAPGSDLPQVIVLRGSGAVLSEEHAISVCELSYWKPTRPINWTE